MASKKRGSGTIGMNEAKQVARPAKHFWFPSGDVVEAETAQEAGEKLKPKSK